MTTQLKNILTDLDGDFNAVLINILSYEEKMKPREKLMTLEPSRTQTARIELEMVRFVNERKLKPDTAEYNHLIATSEDFRTGLKAMFYQSALNKNELSQYIWSKRKAVSDGIMHLKYAMSNNSLSLCMMQMRGIFEQIADFVVVDENTKNSLSPTDSIQENIVKIDDISAVIHQHMLATRIDWENYMSKATKGSKKKSYKPEEGFQSVEAKSVLNSIDILEKKIKGVRRAYEFLCEFTHPNIGTYLSCRISKKVVDKNSPLMFIETNLGTEISKEGIEFLSLPIVGSFQLFAECLFEFEKSAVSLKKLELKIRNHTISSTKRNLKNFPEVWNKNEPCFCLSGKNIGSCCGRKLRTKN